VGEVLDALELPRAAVVAQSMSGGVAARFAIRHPERVSELVLVSPVGFGRVSLMWLVSRMAGVLAPLAPLMAARKVFEGAIRLAYGWQGRPTDRDVDEYWAPSRDPLFVRSLVLLLRQFDWGLLRGEELQRIGCPVLLVAGTDDRVVPSTAVSRMVAMIPSGRVLLIPGAGHAALECTPEIVNRALVAFLRAAEPAA
jgi:pimeloyl-ACP methyl ester carboxylesterase